MSWKSFRIYFTASGREFVETRSSAIAAEGGLVTIVTSKQTSPNNDLSLRIDDAIFWFSQNGFSVQSRRHNYVVMQKEYLEVLASIANNVVTDLALKITVDKDARDHVKLWYDLVKAIITGLPLTMRGFPDKAPSASEFVAVVEQTFAWRSFLQIENHRLRGR